MRCLDGNVVVVRGHVGAQAGAAARLFAAENATVVVTRERSIRA